MKTRHIIRAIIVLIITNSPLHAAHQTASIQEARTQFFQHFTSIQDTNRISDILQYQLPLARSIYIRELVSTLDPTTNPAKAPNTLEAIIALFGAQEDKQTKSVEQSTWYNRCLKEQQLQLNTIKTSLETKNERQTVDDRHAYFSALYNAILGKAETCANTMRAYTTPKPSFKNVMFPHSPYNPLVGAGCFMAATIYQRVQKEKTVLQQCFKAASAIQIVASSYSNFKSHQQKMQVYRKIVNEPNRLY